MLLEQVDELAMVKVNELSIERQQRVGARTASHATHHSGVYVSWNLRSPEIIKEVSDDVTLVALALHAEPLRQRQSLVEAFQIGEHPSLVAEKDSWIARGGNPLCHSLASAYSHFAVRAVFYRYDLHSLFSRHNDLAAQIDNKTLAVRKAMNLGIAHPLQAAMEDDADIDVKQNAVFSSYQLKHLKTLAEEDSFYALPSSCLGDLEALPVVTLV